jgi:small subunit ribosomal protein S9
MNATKKTTKKDEKEVVVKDPIAAPAELETENEDEVLELQADEGMVEEGDDKKEKYFQAVGRRKEAIAIIRLYTKKSSDAGQDEKAILQVNDQDYTQYFRDINLQAVVESPLRKLKSLNRFKATVHVRGGGIAGQADAVKHGLSRALVLFDTNFRKKLKKSGFLTRDSRIKERRKYGLKKARKAPQWQKR